MIEHNGKVVTFNEDVVPSGVSYVVPQRTTGFGKWTDNGTSSNYSDLFDGYKVA